MNTTFILERLRGFYPDSKKLSAPIAVEICEGFERLALGPVAFDDALADYRSKDKRYATPPTWWDLRRHLPLPQRPRPLQDRSKRTVLWPSYVRDEPVYEQAVACWRRADYVAFFETLLTVLSLSNEDRCWAQEQLTAAYEYHAQRHTRREKARLTRGESDNRIGEIIDRLNMSLVPM